MRVIRAAALGLCFGVRDALAVLEQVAEPQRATIHGELVHNQAVLDGLQRRGFGMLGEADRDTLPATPDVVITAHGISEAERARLERAGKKLIDTTCPLVLRVHLAARTLREQGYHVIVIGKSNHVEVRGIVEDLPEHDVVPTPEAVTTYPHRRLGVVCQTTTPPRLAEAIRRRLVACNPQAEVRFVDTICRPTRERQEAVAELVERVEAMVVVGGRNSNNTRELVALCRERGLPTWHVQGAADLDPGWFDGIATVGLTAGTSTLDETVDAVERALWALGGTGASPCC